MTSDVSRSRPPSPLRRWGLRLLLLSGIGALLWAFYCIDEGPPEDADLRLAVVVVSDGENGFVALMAAVAEIVLGDEVPATGKEKEDEEEMAGEADEGEGADGAEEDSEEPILSPRDQLCEFAAGRGWDQELVSKSLAQNGPQLERLDRALEMELFAAAPITSAAQPLLKGWIPVRGAYFVASLRVGERHAAGDDRAALEEALKLVLLGRRLGETGGPMIYYAISLGLSNMARVRFLRFTGEARLEASDWKAALRKLERQEPGQDVLRRVLLAEYAYVCLVIDAAVQGTDPLDSGDLGGGSSPQPFWPWGSRCFFLPNASKRLFGSLCRELVGAKSQEGSFVAVPWNDFLDLAPNRWLPGRNAIGRKGICSSIYAYRGLLEQHQRGVLGRAFLRLTLALRGFHAAQGRLPEKLDELVPEWLPAVPKDPFDCQPIRYDRIRRKLWSVGRDLKDGGGILEHDPENEELDLDEPAWTLPFGE